MLKVDKTTFQFEGTVQDMQIELAMAVAKVYVELRKIFTKEEADKYLHSSITAGFEAGQEECDRDDINVEETKMYNGFKDFMDIMRGKK